MPLSAPSRGPAYGPPSQPGVGDGTGRYGSLVSGGLGDQRGPRRPARERDLLAGQCADVHEHTPGLIWSYSGLKPSFTWPRPADTSNCSVLRVEEKKKEQKLLIK